MITVETIQENCLSIHYNASLIQQIAKGPRLSRDTARKAVRQKLGGIEPGKTEVSSMSNPGAAMYRTPQLF